MILPGLSGSFVLILMGNYELVFIEAVNDMSMRILVPVALGAVFGLVAFSHLLSWVFRHYRNQTISLLTGFILGSLGLLWPWKREIYTMDGLGVPLIRPDGSPVIERYERFLPGAFDTEVIVAMVLMVLGILSIAAIEWVALLKKKQNQE